MFAIQPQDHPTAVSALGAAWSTGLKSDDEDNRDDQDETAQCGDESGWSGESEGKLTPHHKRKKRSQRNPITQDDSKYAPGDVVLGANPRSRWGGDHTAPKSKISTTMVIPPDVVSAESSLIQKGSMNSGLAAGASQLPSGSFQGPQGAGGKRDPQYSTSMSPK